jgi:hypothetical protein
MEFWREPGKLVKIDADCSMFSCAHQEEPQVPADQVQGSLPEEPLHPCPEGLRQGRQAQAEPASWYVTIASSHRLSCGGIRLHIFEGLGLGQHGTYADSYFIALKVVDVSKGTKKAN